MTQPFDPIFDSQAVFRVLMAAMARPGTFGRLPARDARCPLPALQPLAAMLLTLLDHEVSFAVVGGADQGVGETLTRYLTSATSSRVAPVEQADYVVAVDGLTGDIIARLKRGAPAYPDESATLLVHTPSLAAPDGPLLDLTGPGLAQATRVRLSGLAAEHLTTLAEVNSEPPCGIDLILADADGAIACLPRSTRIQVV